MVMPRQVCGYLFSCMIYFVSFHDASPLAPDILFLSVKELKAELRDQDWAIKGNKDVLQRRVHTMRVAIGQTLKP